MPRYRTRPSGRYSSRARETGARTTFYPEFLDPRDKDAGRSAIVRLMAKFPTIAAFFYKHSIGQPFVYPDNALDYTSNFLRMMFATPCAEYEADPVVARVLDLLLILHADHEQNCSTSTVRLVGSSLSNLFASISAGIGALWGPLHGGANQKVIEMHWVEMQSDPDFRIRSTRDPRARRTSLWKNGRARLEIGMGMGADEQLGCTNPPNCQ